TGNTTHVARDIAVRMGADLESIRDREHRTGFFGALKASFDAVRGRTVNIAPLFRDPADYALTIVGTPVWAGRMTPAVRTFLQQARGRLGRVAFFVTSAHTGIAQMLPALEAAAHTKAIAAAGFNAHELKDQDVYASRLADFLNELEWRYLTPEAPALEPGR